MDSLPNSADNNPLRLTDETARRFVEAWLTAADTPRRELLQHALRDDGAVLRWSSGVAGLAEPALVDWLDQYGPAAMIEQLEHLPAAELSASSAQLLVLLRTQQRLRELETKFAEALQQEKLSAMVALAAGAGHEINNPLGSIAGRAQLLLRDEEHPERRRALAKINTQAFRAHEMIADMMLFAEPPVPKRTPTELVEVVNQVVKEMESATAERRITLIWPGTYSGATETPPSVDVDPTQIAVALSALLRNAMEAIGEGGSIDISLREIEATTPLGSRQSWHEFTIVDDGPGIPAETRAHLFDPFFSGREAGRGLGFGLSKCWRIVTAHEGEIEVDSEPGRGARFTLRLPGSATPHDVQP